MGEQGLSLASPGPGHPSKALGASCPAGNASRFCAGGTGSESPECVNATVSGSWRLAPGLRAAAPPRRPELGASELHLTTQQSLSPSRWDRPEATRPAHVRPSCPLMLAISVPIAPAAFEREAPPTPSRAVKPVCGTGSLGNVLERVAPAEFATDFQGKRAQMDLWGCFLKINNPSSCCAEHSFCCAGQVKIAWQPAFPLTPGLQRDPCADGDC